MNKKTIPALPFSIFSISYLNNKEDIKAKRKEDKLHKEFTHLYKTMGKKAIEVLRYNPGQEKYTIHNEISSACSFFDLKPHKAEVDLNRRLIVRYNLNDYFKQIDSCDKYFDFAAGEYKIYTSRLELKLHREQILDL